MKLFFWKKQEVRLPDPWEGVCNSYVENYRKKLDAAARVISERWSEVVATEFQPETKCAVLRGADSGVIARVIVHGEYGLPYMAIVMTDYEEKIQKTMESALVGLKVKFKELRPAL